MDLERIEAAIEAVLFTMGESVEVIRLRLQLNRMRRLQSGLFII